MWETCRKIRISPGEGGQLWHPFPNPVTMAPGLKGRRKEPEGSARCCVGTAYQGLPLLTPRGQPTQFQGSRGNWGEKEYCYPFSGSSRWPSPTRSHRIRKAVDRLTTAIRPQPRRACSRIGRETDVKGGQCGCQSRSNVSANAVACIRCPKRRSHVQHRVKQTASNSASRPMMQLLIMTP